MTISPISTPILTPEQANPWAYKARQMNDITSGILQNYMSGQKAKYLPNALEQEQQSQKQALQQAILNNQILQAKAQYAPQMSLAELQNTQAEAPYKQALAQQALGSAAQSGAQAGLIGEEAKAYPYKTMAEIQKSQNVASRFNNPDYIAALKLRGLTAAQKTALGAENAATLEQIANTAYNQQMQPAQAQGQDPQLNAIMQQYASQIPTLSNLQRMKLDKTFQGAQNQIPPQQYGNLAQLINAASPGAAQMSQQQAQAQQQDQYQQQDQSQQQPQSQQQDQYQQQADQNRAVITPQSTNNIDDQFKLQAAQKLAGSKMNNRAQSAIAMEKWFNDNRYEFANRINDAVNYAGVKGRGKRYADAWLNEHPEALQNYDWFNNTFKLNAANQIKMMEAMGATDQQFGELQNMLGAIDKVDSNPQRAKAAIDNAMGTLQGLSNSVLNTADGPYKGIYRKAYNLTPFEGKYTDINAAATQKGLVAIRSADGNIWHIPKDKLDVALKRGAKKI